MNAPGEEVGPFTHQEVAVASPCRLCCSCNAGSAAVLRALSHSVASASNSTYSLCARCRRLQALPYLSRVSSSLRPPLLVGPGMLTWICWSFSIFLIGKAPQLCLRKNCTPFPFSPSTHTLPILECIRKHSACSIFLSLPTALMLTQSLLE